MAACMKFTLYVGQNLTLTSLKHCLVGLPSIRDMPMRIKIIYIIVKYLSNLIVIELIYDEQCEPAAKNIWETRCIIIVN